MKSLPTIKVTFVVMAAVLLTTLAVTYWIGKETNRCAGEITNCETSLRQIQQAFSTLQDAETGQRGFLLTGREKYLQPYLDALDEMPARFRHLRYAAQQGEIPLAFVERLQALVDGKIAELKETVSLERNQGQKAAMEVVLSDAGIKTMNEIRAIFAEITAGEERRMKAAVQASRDLVNLRTWIFLLGIFVNLGFLVWAYFRIRREINQRYVADLETQRQREILAVSLASIGDAVILTDTEARITFMNERAEQISGWKNAEAVGQPCSSVFRIINETSRQTVENPVDQVLKTGKIVGLANHTLLVRKDGTEVPIDDSGAPIRESDGVIRGVVLVFRDFSEHKQAERDLREVKDRLELANQAKDDFIAALSHELRTPLTPLLGTLSSWEQNQSLPEHLANDVRMLIRNVRLEVRLIDDLLDLTRISRGEITLYREDVDVHALLQAVVEIFRKEAETRQIRIGLRSMAERHQVHGDPARLQQIFWNIIGNSMKHTPIGGRIEIVTTNEDGQLRIAIADNGRGMTAETIETLFLPYLRPKCRDGYQPGGLGIGLTISHHLVEAHGGSIKAQSDGPDLGSTFLIRLPCLDRVAEPAPVPAEARGEAPAASVRLAILLVEDHEDSALVIARIVRNMGHSVVVSSTVAESLTELRAQKFDLVLSDIGLPDGTGIELLAQARKFTTVPMIALTGYGMEDDLEKYRTAGFLYQLTKPVRFDQLQRLIEGFSSGRG